MMLLTEEAQRRIGKIEPRMAEAPSSGKSRLLAESLVVSKTWTGVDGLGLGLVSIEAAGWARGRRTNVGRRERRGRRLKCSSLVPLERMETHGLVTCPQACQCALPPAYRIYAP